MELGTGLFTCQRRPDEDRPAGVAYEEMLRLARAVEAAGLDSVWTSEHHFQPDGYFSGTMPALGALAAATDDIEIGSCIAPAPLYDAVRLAEDAATVDLLADGRLTLGLAIGSNPREFGEFGVPLEKRADRLEDAVRVLRGAWSDGPIEYDADYHEISPSTTVTPKPDGEIPVMLGGAAKPAVRRAARLGDAWCAPSALSLDGVEKRVRDLRSVASEAGREVDVYVIQHGFVADSRSAAWEAMCDGYFYLQRRYAEMFSGERVTELSADRRAELKDRAVFGTPERVVDRLSEYRDALGDDIHVILRTFYPGVDTERTVACLERLGDEVAPALA